MRSTLQWKTLFRIGQQNAVVAKVVARVEVAVVAEVAYHGQLGTQNSATAGRISGLNKIPAKVLSSSILAVEEDVERAGEAEEGEGVEEADVGDPEAGVAAAAEAGPKDRGRADVFLPEENRSDS